MNHQIAFASVAAVIALGASIVMPNAVTSPSTASADGTTSLDIATIHWEYNASGDDLGVHVFLDGEDWKLLKIKRPDNKTIFEVKGKGAYAQLGLTELFFEGAEPSLAKVPLVELLAKFPEGVYAFQGLTVDGDPIEGESMFTHAVPAAPVVSIQQGPANLLQISWNPVTGSAPGFPSLPIVISGYQVLVDETFQVTLPASATSVTVSPEFVASLSPGTHECEVLAIEQGGNQTITEADFVK